MAERKVSNRHLDTKNITQPPYHEGMWDHGGKAINSDKLDASTTFVMILTLFVVDAAEYC
jgi:hypothetical protein